MSGPHVIITGEPGETVPRVRYCEPAFNVYRWTICFNGAELFIAHAYAPKRQLETQRALSALTWHLNRGPVLHAFDLCDRVVRAFTGEGETVYDPLGESNHIALTCLKLGRTYTRTYG